MSGRLLAPGIFLALLTLAVTGCGGDKPIKVEGTVTLDKVPVPNVTVRFLPQDGSGTMATGVTGDDGEFRLTTYSTGDGAMAGDYKIVIDPPKEMVDTPAVGGGGEPDPEKITDAMKEYYKHHTKKPGSGDAESKKKSPIHENYTKEDRTPLKQKVPTNGKVEVELHKSGN